eukprot:TRINITY_DN1151_c0_g1_i8.p1 TRINITY_DN1151_c0_g1~~TRINITY_DN1151_c0_g1_i8.p1  ORF type:complete len:101 (+),score=8.21 TRINITY_DN1151_c0_g1_i8:127-429(+)
MFESLIKQNCLSYRHMKWYTPKSKSHKKFGRSVEDLNSAYGRHACSNMQHSDASLTVLTVGGCLEVSPATPAAEAQTVLELWQQEGCECVPAAQERPTGA